jgi:hypothetical protein
LPWNDRFCASLPFFFYRRIDGRGRDRIDRIGNIRITKAKGCLWGTFAAANCLGSGSGGFPPATQFFAPLNPRRNRMTTTTLASASGASRTVWPVRLLGWLCILLGLVLLAGGIWLIALGGSWYYALAGLGLIGTGALLDRGSIGALWLYLATWLGTLIWAWWEVGADWWAQLPRLVAPTLVLLFVLICVPALRHTRTLTE